MEPNRKLTIRFARANLLNSNWFSQL